MYDACRFKKCDFYQILILMPCTWFPWAPSVLTLKLVKTLCERVGKLRQVEQREEVGRRGVQLQEEAQTTPKTLYVLQTTQYMYMYVYRVVHRVENNLLLTSNLLEKNVHTNLYPNSWQASTS